MAKTKQDVLRLIKRVGAKLIENNPHDFEAEAPQGKRWQCDGVHWLVASLLGGDDTMSLLWTDLWNRMDFGLEDCKEVNCECCEGSEA